MTEESINDLVRNAAKKILVICGSTPIPLKVNKGVTMTVNEAFFMAYSTVLYQQYLFEVEAHVNAGLNKELLLITLKDKWIEHQRKADNLLIKQQELKYIAEYNPDKLITTEYFSTELIPCQFDQIREQLYADFYKLVISDLSTQKLPQKPQLKNVAAFFITIYILGRLGIVEEFPLGGTSTNDVQKKVTKAAETAMNAFGGEYNIKTLHSYLRDTKTKFKEHLTNVGAFLFYHYPERESEIKLILLHLDTDLKK